MGLGERSFDVEMRFSPELTLQPNLNLFPKAAQIKSKIRITIKS